MKFDFNKNRLRGMLSNVDIEYVHIPELGIPREKRQNLATQNDYEKLFNEYASSLLSRKTYLEKVINLGLSNRIGIMCFEKNAEMFHRREIGKYIEKEGFKVLSL